MATEQIHIRRAEPHEAAVIAEIWRAAWHDGHDGNVPAELVAARDESSFTTRAAQRTGDTTVAVVDGEVAGFIMVDGDEVEQVFVAANHRGRGVADVLLEEAERQVRAAGHPSTWLAVVPGNTRARRFYERHGWVDAGSFTHAALVGNGFVAVPCRRYVKDFA
ncbi:GNAT family N-acetyltransferase [Saccharomonospora sp. NPDC046836]|uniref:GNAT family N-acetyltransferase n=1 Tax=Saccharomonospora sp. NPDC046836 TaxID=3156921 RepID=UPI00340C3DE7